MRSEARVQVCFCLHAEENSIIEAGRDRASGGDPLLSICYISRPDFQPQALQYFAPFSPAFNAQRKLSTLAFLR